MKKRKSPVEGLQCPSCGDGIGSVWQGTGKNAGTQANGATCTGVFSAAKAQQNHAFFPVRQKQAFTSYMEVVKRRSNENVLQESE